MKIIKNIKKSILYVQKNGLKAFFIKSICYLAKTLNTEYFDLKDKESILEKILNEEQEIGINTSENRDKKIIVSLTSFPERMHNMHYALYSILKQSLKPDLCILWLGEDKFQNKEHDLPESILQFKKLGLTIKWCKDIKSYTKLIPTLKEFPDDIIITFDDDVFYHKDTIKVLYNSYLEMPHYIHCNRAHHITFSSSGEILPYRQWQTEIKNIAPSYNNFFTGVGGVLYPPYSLHKEIFNETQWQSLTPYGDDIWFWAMAVLNNTKTCVTKECVPYVDICSQRACAKTKEKTLFALNVLQNKNDEQLYNVINAYSLNKKL